MSVYEKESRKIRTMVLTALLMALILVSLPFLPAFADEEKPTATPTAKPPRAVIEEPTDTVIYKNGTYKLDKSGNYATFVKPAISAKTVKIVDQVTISGNKVPVTAIAAKAFYKDKRYLHHSRIPVYANDDEYITGYILRMEALQLMAEDKFDKTLGDIRRDIASFGEETPLDQIWDEMLSKDEQIAVVLNEYGSFQGIITLEDVIETILGDEIVDENDLVRDMQELALEKWKRRNQMAQKKQKNRENPDKA